MAADVAGDGLERVAELVDLDGQAGEGERFAGLLAVLLDQRAELGTPVEGGPADAGESGDGVGGDGFAVGGELGAGLFDADDVVGRLRCARAGCCSSGLGGAVGAEQHVEAGDQRVVTGRFLGPAAVFGVGGQDGGVGALRGQDRPGGGVGVEARAVFADVGVGAGALCGGADAVPAGEAGLDAGCFPPVLVGR